MIPSKSIGSEDQHEPGSDCGVTWICARRHRRRTSRSLARRRQHLHQGRPRHRLQRSRLGNPAGAGRCGHSDTPTLSDGRSLYVLEGSGIFTLNDAQHPFGKGGTIFIPKNAWHEFANPDHELLLLWIMAPPGLDGFFRDTCSPPGVSPKQLTREQVNETVRKYATEFK